MSSNSGLLNSNSVFQRVENSDKLNGGNEALNCFLTPTAHSVYFQSNFLVICMLSLRTCIFYFVIDADAGTKSKLSEQLACSSRRIKEISSSVNMPKHIVSETSSNQETKAKVKIFQELRKITSNTEIC